MSLSPLRQKSGLGALLLSHILSPSAQAWTSSLGADLSAPFKQGDPSMSLGFSTSNDFSKKWGLALSQGLEKNFYYDSSSTEWELSDSVVALNLYPRTLIPELSWKLRLQATLPLSHVSQVNEVYSKPEARLYSTYPVNETMNLVLNAFGRYTWSRYQSAAAQDGIGGAPLPQFSYGLAQNGSWTFIPSWNFAYGMSYTEIIYNTITYEGVGDPPIFDQPDQAYSLSLSLSWSVSESMGLRASYSYGGLLLQPGLDDYVLFDEEDSRWSLGVSTSF